MRKGILSALVAFGLMAAGCSGVSPAERAKFEEAKVQFAQNGVVLNGWEVKNKDGSPALGPLCKKNDNGGYTFPDASFCK